MELGWELQESVLPRLRSRFNEGEDLEERRLPYLAGLLCLSVFDIALHDAFDHLEIEYDAVWRLAPVFGPVPPALERSYPLTAEFPERLDAPARETAIDGVARLAEAHPGTAVSVLAGEWPRACFEGLPEGVTLLNTGA